jgi:hypothetical protein
VFRRTQKLNHSWPFTERNEFHIRRFWHQFACRDSLCEGFIFEVSLAHHGCEWTLVHVCTWSHLGARHLFIRKFARRFSTLKFLLRSFSLTCMNVIRYKISSKALLSFEVTSPLQWRAAWAVETIVTAADVPRCQQAKR